VLKLTSCTNVVVRYLNIVNGVLAGHDGLEFKRTSLSTAHCNCVAFHDDEGIQLDAGKSNVITANRVTRNLLFGIDLDDATKLNTVQGNISLENGGHGLIVQKASTQNLITGNDLLDNDGDGIDLNNALQNQVTLNDVEGNAMNGIAIENNSLSNIIDGNAISGNGDGLVNVIDCIGGDLNTGSNVPGSSPCR
jgi:parallel beta-helix repeat protein